MPPLHNNLHLSIPHQLLRKYLSRYINRKPHILSRRARRHYLDIKRHHSYLPILLQRRHSSHQVCGATPSPAHTTLQGTSGVGTWKTMALLSWTTLFRRSARGRPRTYSHFFSSLYQPRHGHKRLYNNNNGSRRSLHDDVFPSTSPRFFTVVICCGQAMIYAILCRLIYFCTLFS